MYKKGGSRKTAALFHFRTMKPTQEQLDQIIPLYQQYGNGAPVAKQLGITTYMVYKHLRANGIEPKKNGQWQQKVDLQTIVDMYQSGMSTTQIASKLKMDATSVWERLNNSGIQLRDRGDAMAKSRWGGKKRGTDQEVIALYISGMNCKQISDYYGLKNSRAEIARVLHKHDIKIEVHAERSPHWKGGKLALNKMIRNCAKYVNWRNEIFKEHDYTCELTGQRGGKLNVHHIKPLADLISEFQLQHPAGFASQDDQLRAIEDFQPFWDKANVMVVTKDAHRKIHMELSLPEAHNV